MDTETISFPVPGREEICSRLEQRLEALKRGYRQNLSLVGPPTIGKTFLLRHFLAKVRHDPELISIYVSLEGIDFESFSERWLGALLQAFLASKQIPFPEEFQTLVKISRSYIPRTLARMREAKKQAFQKKISIAFRQLLSLTGALGEETGKKILLILDEFQELEGVGIADPFALFGKEMMVQKDTLYLTTSSKPHRAREIFDHRLALLFGNFEIIPVGPLRLEAIREWSRIAYPELRLAEFDFRMVCHLFENRSHYLDLLFDSLRTRRVQRGTGHDPGAEIDRSFLLETLEEVLFSEKGLLNGHFESELKGLAGLGKALRCYWRVLLAISNGRNKILPIAAYLGKKLPEVQKLLQRLVEQGLIEKNGSFYRLEDSLFGFWLRHVYFLKDRNLEPNPDHVRPYFRARLEEEFRRMESEEKQDLTEKVESLFRQFRNEVVELNHRKTRCPVFLEVASRPTNGRYFPILGRTSHGRWFCEVARDPLSESDVIRFNEELKRFRRRIERPILIALGGLELNARLMAQEAKIQIWELNDFNALLDLYGKLKVIA